MTSQLQDSRAKQPYTPPARGVELVEAPPMPFLMIDGVGDPSTAPAYKEAVEALYSVSYALKFALKKQAGLDYRVGPLEGLWWAPDVGRVSISELMQHRDRWRWTMMIAQPEGVTNEQVDAAIEKVRRKRAAPGLERLRLERFDEGLCAQTLHIGPYASELATVERLHAYIREHGLRLRGKHHEIYLGDPQRVQPDRLRTILRQPVESVPGKE